MVRQMVWSCRLALSEHLDGFFQLSSGAEGTFNEHFVGKTNVKRLFHFEKHGDRSHRIQTQLHEFYVVIDGVGLRRTEVSAQGLLELSGYVIHILIIGVNPGLLHRSGPNTRVPRAQAMHRNDRGRSTTHLSGGLQAGKGD